MKTDKEMIKGLNDLALWLENNLPDVELNENQNDNNNSNLR